MDDKLKVFWNLDILVKMCRSKSDGPALRVEEQEIEEKCAGYQQEIEDIKSTLTGNSEKLKLTKKLLLLLKKGTISIFIAIFKNGSKTI